MGVVAVGGDGVLECVCGVGGVLFDGWGDLWECCWDH